MIPSDPWLERLQGSQREEAIAELRELLVRGLSRSLAQRGGGASFAEDVAQEALIRILDSLDTFQGKSKFTTWALTIATRLAISELRRRRYKDVSLQSMVEGDALRVAPEADETHDKEESAERKRILNELSRLIDEHLSEKQRVAMQAVLEGMPVEEIAKFTGSNRNAIYKLIHDARKKLREGLEANGVSQQDLSLFSS